MLHWISNSRVSLQRLGFCKLAIVLCDKCHSRSELADKVRPILEKSEPIPMGPEIIEWLNSRPKKKKNLQGNNLRITNRQDYWLFKHPNQTGRLSELAFNEYFNDIGLPFILGLLDEDCRKTSLGNLLMVLQDADDKDMLWEPPKNPITLSKRDQTLFMLSLLKKDGDLLIPFMHALANRFGLDTFSYREAGELLPEIMEGILKKFANVVGTSSDRAEYNSLKAARAKIMENIEKRVETQGFGSRREQTVVPRLEWLVDLGILIRTEGQKYRYSLCTRSQMFTERLYSSYIDTADKGYIDEAVDKTLDSHFMGIIYQLLYESEGKETQVEDIIRFLSPAYSEFSNMTGYCVVRPLLLLSHIKKWDKGESPLLEYDQTIKLLEEAYQQNPDDFYFTTTRFGEDYQIKIDNIK